MNRIKIEVYIPFHGRGIISYESSYMAYRMFQRYKKLGREPKYLKTDG